MARGKTTIGPNTVLRSKTDPRVRRRVLLVEGDTVWLALNGRAVAASFREVEEHWEVAR